MKLEKIFSEVKGGRKLSERELADLKKTILDRSATPYELSQIVLTYCHLRPIDADLVVSIADLASEYVKAGDEEKAFCA
ncbi:MAG: hypothetical protein OEY05_04075, partial [Paracoccaceae bacterium]|nr:hypothetical protein [Paracoccaceae bacterium]